MKKPITLILMTGLLAAGLSSLTACGDNFDGLTINFWHTSGQTVANGFQKAADDFAAKVLAHDNVKLRIKLTYKGGYDDLKGEIEKNLATGGNPTIAVAYPDHIADYFLAGDKNNHEYVVKLDDYANDDEIGFGREEWLGDSEGVEDFIQAYYEEGIQYQKEGLYSIPLLKSTEAVIYNFNIVKDALIGKKINDTLTIQYDADELISTEDDVRAFMSDISWETFMDLCEFMYTNKNYLMPTMVWPCFYDSDSNLIISNFMQANMDYSGIVDGHGYIGFNGIASNATSKQIENYDYIIEELGKYKEWYDKGLFSTKGVYGEYSSNQLLSMKTVFAVGSTGGSGYSMPTSKDFQIGVCKVPYINNNPLYVSQGITLTLMNNAKLEKSGENDLAVKYGWKFIKYLTNAEVNANMATTCSEGYMPVRDSAYNTSDFLGFMNSNTEYVKVAKVIIDDIQNRYFNTAVFSGSAKLREATGGMLADVLKISGYKNMTEDQKLEAITTQVNRAINAAI